MPRGIDHLVLCVNDLKKARTAYEALGFTMTPQAQHPFGTGNTIVQLDGCFLEVLGVTRPEDITEASGDTFSFAAFNRDFLKSREGMSMLVLDSTDEVADRAAFLNSGLHVYAPFDFQRQAKMPSGDDVTVGFSLTFVGAPNLDEMGFFTCRQWRPDLFWKPDYQRHGNGAKSIAEVFVVTPDPTDAATFLSAFADAPVSETAPGTQTVTSTRGKLSVFSPDAFEARFPGAFPHARDGAAFFGGFALKVADPRNTCALWAANGVSFHVAPAGAWLAPTAGLGCVIAIQ